MTAKEIAALFASLELRLIQSLKRNLLRHKQEEAEEGFDWSMWQAEKLKSLNAFRKQNATIVKEYSSVINPETEKLLEEQYNEGSSGSFFGVNNRKVEALIKEMQAINNTVEKSAFRFTNDVYRKTIMKASTALGTGSVTLQQAVDMATKDFLEKGINSIEYSNGRRVNIATYAEMALRANSTKAMLMGEAEKRKALGIDTVLVSQYGACSETCLPWQGKVYIDDVYGEFSGEVKDDKGLSVNGRWYTLLSVAVRAGLFHPNCRHTLTSWYEGISTMPKSKDPEEITRVANLEAKQRYYETQVRKYKRLVEGSANPQNQEKYRLKLNQAQSKLREFVKENSDVLRRDPWRERLDAPAYDMVADEKSTTAIPVTQNSFNNLKPITNSLAMSKNTLAKLNPTIEQFLRKVAKEPLGTEIAEVYNTNMEMVGAHKGEIGKFSLKIPRYEGVHLVIHNHPSGSFFSFTDIETFVNRDSMHILIAVGNDGSIYVIEKTATYNQINAKSFLGEIEKNYVGHRTDFDLSFSLVEKILFGGKLGDYGINYYKV